MQDAENRSNNLTRRGALTVAGAAITVATVHTTGGALAQSTEQSAAPQQETRNASTGKNSIKLAHKRAKTNGVNLHYITAGRGPTVVHAWLAAKPP
jgi:hypothetical protein